MVTGGRGMSSKTLGNSSLPLPLSSDFLTLSFFSSFGKSTGVSSVPGGGGVGGRGGGKEDFGGVGVSTVLVWAAVVGVVGTGGIGDTPNWLDETVVVSAVELIGGGNGIPGIPGIGWGYMKLFQYGNMCGGIPKGNPPNGGTIGKFGIIPPNATWGGICCDQSAWEYGDEKLGTDCCPWKLLLGVLVWACSENRK